MIRWERKLAAWADAGLLTAKQRDRILDFERSAVRTNIAAYTVIGLGAIIIAIGVISLIAYNWDAIPDRVKLAANFILLIAGALAAARAYGSARSIAFEIICSVFFMLIGASIGLISQVFHSGGAFYEAATVWAAIALPLVLASRGTVTVHLWMTIAIIALYGQIDQSLSEALRERSTFTVVLLSAHLPAALGIAALALRRRSDEDIATLGRSLAVWAFAGALVGTIFLSVPSDYGDAFSPGPWIATVLVANGALVATACALAWKVYGRGIIVLASGIALYALLAITNLRQVHPDIREVTDAALFILAWFVAAFFLFRLDYRKLFNALIVGIGIRFLVVYFQVFSDLAMTGLGLIVSGLAIIGLSALYIKKRESLYALMERIK
ncbi:MAG TPA: DUF2157 domain-containing protein [Spirochaetota bacterium]|nr:DUF2157 domain-containing protein [Spirochaetota bacterium]HNT09511.1 DUF2157 domain-containing protein [Spirochaetota bacterium]